MSDNRKIHPLISESYQLGLLSLTFHADQPGDYDIDVDVESLDCVQQLRKQLEETKAELAKLKGEEVAEA